MNRRNAIALLGALPLASVARAQDNWPTRPVREGLALDPVADVPGSPGVLTMSDVREVQLLIIGGGPGGYPAALHAADHGMTISAVTPDVVSRNSNCWALP